MNDVQDKPFARKEAYMNKNSQLVLPRENWDHADRDYCKNEYIENGAAAD